MFNYGKLIYKRRFSINRSLKDYEAFFISNLISVESWFGYKTMARDNLVHEYHILYRTDDLKDTKLIKLDARDYTIKLVSLGDSKINI